MLGNPNKTNNHHLFAKLEKTFIVQNKLDRSSQKNTKISH